MSWHCSCQVVIYLRAKQHPPTMAQNKLKPQLECSIIHAYSDGGPEIFIPGTKYPNVSDGLLEVQMEDVVLTFPGSSKDIVGIKDAKPQPRKAYEGIPFE